MTLYEARTAATKRLENDQTVSRWWIMVTGGFRREFTLCTDGEVAELMQKGWKRHGLRERKAVAA